MQIVGGGGLGYFCHCTCAQDNILTVTTYNCHSESQNRLNPVSRISYSFTPRLLCFVSTCCNCVARSRVLREFYRPRSNNRSHCHGDHVTMVTSSNSSSPTQLNEHKLTAMIERRLTSLIYATCHIVIHIVSMIVCHSVIHIVSTGMIAGENRGNHTSVIMRTIKHTLGPKK